MKRVTPISKKSRQILILCVCFFTLVSCYEFDPLPDKIKSKGEYAIPLIDTTISVEQFTSISYGGEMWNMIEIPEGRPLNMGEFSFPFYIGDYASSQTIEWIEPQMIIDSKDLLPGTILQMNIYIKNDNGTKSYFWLSPEESTVTLKELEDMPVKIPNPVDKVTGTDLEKVRNARKIFMDLSIKYPTSMLVETILTHKINIKMSMKFAIETDLSINL
jgi:hypothetical protein